MINVRKVPFCVVVVVVVSLLASSGVSVNAIGNGVNLQPSYYNNGNVTFGWELMHKYAQVKTVRIEVEPGYESQARNWIQQAAENRYEIIVTYHDYHYLGSDDYSVLMTAGNWWISNYNYLHNQNGKYYNFTVNLMNEWGSHDQTSDSYSEAYNQAISQLRTIYSGLIIIDIPGWGQETHTAAQASPKIHDSNIMLSAHIYPNGWNQGYNRNVQASDMDELYNTGRPCIIGEFGTGIGPVNVGSVVTRAKELGFPVQAWAWNGDGENLNMVTPYWYQNAQSSDYNESLPYFWDVIQFI